MAMNNWGGIKEHMSKKPRSVFGNRNLMKSNERKKQSFNIDERQVNNNRRKKVFTEIIWFIIILILVAIVYINLF